MIIWIKYKDKLILVNIIGDNKAELVTNDEPEMQEFDQCLNCGKWCGQDDEFYGDGYCTHCCEMCPVCEQYRNHTDMIVIGEERVCSTCNDNVSEA